MPSRNAFVTVLIIALIVGFLYLQRAAVFAGLDSLKLIPRPERFTELYFKNPSALPRAIKAGQPLSFAFVIRNAEGGTTKYPYEVYFKDANGGRVDLTSGAVVLANDASTTIAVSHVFSEPGIRGAVVVALPELNGQSIDFLLPNNG